MSSVIRYLEEPRGALDLAAKDERVLAAIGDVARLSSDTLGRKGMPICGIVERLLLPL